MTIMESAACARQITVLMPAATLIWSPFSSATADFAQLASTSRYMSTTSGQRPLLCNLILNQVIVYILFTDSIEFVNKLYANYCYSELKLLDQYSLVAFHFYVYVIAILSKQHVKLKYVIVSDFLC